MSNPIRVLHMIGSLNIGGSQAVVINLYRAINRDLIQFDFIIDKANETELASIVKSMGAKIYVMPSFKGTNIVSVRESWKSFFKEHPEYRILHSHIRSYASIYLPIAKKYGLRTIEHSHSTSNGEGVTAFIKAMLQFPLRFQADYLFACSLEAGEWLFGKRAIQNKEFIILKNAIDARRFGYNEEIRGNQRRYLGIENNYVIGHIGRFSEPKNHEFLIKLFSRIKEADSNTKLLLVGNGEIFDKIKKTVDDLNLKDSVIFIGAQARVEDYYQAMDVFVFPSKWEGLGISAIEAQTSGLPCIVSKNVPLAADIGAGLFFQIDLNTDIDRWIDTINSFRGFNRTDKQEYTIKSGYDVNTTASFLEDFYIKVSEID